MTTISPTASVLFFFFLVLGPLLRNGAAFLSTRTTTTTTSRRITQLAPTKISNVPRSRPRNTGTTVRSQSNVAEEETPTTTTTETTTFETTATLFPALVPLLDNPKFLALQMAAESFDEGQGEFYRPAENANYAAAAQAYAQAIAVGRRAVQTLVAEQNDTNQMNDNSNQPTGHTALAWLTTAHLQCARAHAALEQWDDARSHAWAASVHSSSSSQRDESDYAPNLRQLHQQALQCQLDIGRATGDALGQLTTLQALLVLATADQDAENLRQQISSVQAELDKQFGGK